MDWLIYLVVSGIQPYWSAKFLVALLTFRLTEQGTFNSAHEKKQALLASSYSSTSHNFAANVALMVWSNHDEDNYYLVLNKRQFKEPLASTAIGLWKHRIPSDLRS